MSPAGNNDLSPRWFRSECPSGDVAVSVDLGDRCLTLSQNDLPQAVFTQLTNGAVGIEALAPFWRELSEIDWTQFPEQRFTTASSANLNQTCLPAVVNPGKIIALGRTFPAHVAELGNEPAKEPLVFAKNKENIVGGNSSLAIPWQEGERFDNEIELAAVLQDDLKNANTKAAEEAVMGWCMVNDFTWRSEQSRAKNAGAPWYVAKNLNGCLPVGPFLLPKLVLRDPRFLKFSCSINDELVQAGDFSGMSDSPYALIAWLSGRIDLKAGDLIALGTPKGVTRVRPNDRIETTIDALGTLSHTVVQKELVS